MTVAETPDEIKNAIFRWFYQCKQQARKIIRSRHRCVLKDERLPHALAPEINLKNVCAHRWVCLRDKRQSLGGGEQGLNTCQPQTTCILSKFRGSSTQIPETSRSAFNCKCQRADLQDKLFQKNEEILAHGRFCFYLLKLISYEMWKKYFAFLSHFSPT